MKPEPPNTAASRSPDAKYSAMPDPEREANRGLHRRSPGRCTEDLWSPMPLASVPTSRYSLRTRAAPPRCRRLADEFGLSWRALTSLRARGDGAIQALSGTGRFEIAVRKRAGANQG